MSDSAVTRPLGSQRPNEATISTRATNVSTSSASGIATPATASSTQTMTETRGESQEVLRLTLRDRPNVTWDENVVDNEGMGRKSSKRCCIFHKERPFGESSTDSSDYEDEGDEGKKIAYKKLVGKKKTPDHLRFHA